MKYITLLLVFLLANVVWANCVDLSHKTKIGASDLEIRQIGCSQLHRQIYFQGQPVGDASVVALDGKWKTESVDDQYESSTRQGRWLWNSTGSVLIQDFIVDTKNKGSGDLSVYSGTQVYKKTSDGRIYYDQYSQMRILKKDDSGSVEQNHKSEIRESLN